MFFTGDNLVIFVKNNTKIPENYQTVSCEKHKKNVWDHLVFFIVFYLAAERLAQPNVFGFLQSDMDQTNWYKSNWCPPGPAYAKEVKEAFKGVNRPF